MNEIKLKTIDQIEIAVNCYKNGFDSVVIIAPGWFMTKDSKSFREISDIFKEYSDVLAMDFRGHGRSKGFYTFTTKEINDISTVIEYAKQHYRKIYLMGFSLGAALVLIAGSKFDYIDKIIAISAPTCFSKIENKVWKKEAWIPTLQKCELKRWVSIRPSIINRKKITGNSQIARILSPSASPQKGSPVL